MRRDITEGNPGTPLVVALRVVEAGSCAPIPGAMVDIWHTDIAGGIRGSLDRHACRASRTSAAS